MTARGIYASLVRWHPSRFQASFADEMLATFEDASFEQSSASLIADAIVSLSVSGYSGQTTGGMSGVAIARSWKAIRRIPQEGMVGQSDLSLCLLGTHAGIRHLINQYHLSDCPSGVRRDWISAIQERL
jgi:hypothetical protein